MVVQQVERVFHQLAQGLLALAARIVGSDGLSDNLVWRRADNLHRAVAPAHQVAVADADKEVDARGAEFLLQQFDKGARLVRGDSAATVIEQGFAIGANQRAAEGDIVRLQRHAHRGSFQRGTPCVMPTRVIAQQRHVRHIAARIHARRHR
jgi:hypothetical protein